MRMSKNLDKKTFETEFFVFLANFHQTLKPQELF